MGIINSNLTKLGSFLGNEKLYIPEYQRGYSWEETQLDDFWQDLKQIYEENTHDEHFLGQVVIHKNKEDGKRYIIDGQQRISTTIIFLDILRTKFKEIAPPPNMTLPCTYRSKALRLKSSESITQATTGVVQFANPL